MLLVVSCWFSHKRIQVRQDAQGSQAAQVSRMCKKVHGSKVHRFGSVPLTAYLKLAALYELCAAPPFLTVFPGLRPAPEGLRFL